MFKYQILLILLLIPLPILTQNAVSAADSLDNGPVGGLDHPYHLRIEESQWKIKVIDLNDPAQKEYEGRVGPFVRGANVTIDVYTRDVQHGFSINEVGVAIATIRPTVGEKFGAKTSATFTLPDKDVTLSAFCHIFCGLGHPDMKLKIIVGKGSFEAGPIVFYIAIVINLSILAIVVRAIIKKTSVQSV